MNATLRQNEWLNASQVSEEDKKIIRNYSLKEAEDAFFKDIEFGTAGMRGIMGPGSNRINYFTIQKAAYAFAIYLRETFPNQLHRGVVIGHDNRKHAETFTSLTALILRQCGIDAYTFKELVPTPLLSYAVRSLNAIGGVMLTASHNPKEHNGFKVYDEFGCQLVPHKIEKVICHLKTLPQEIHVKIPTLSPQGQLKRVPEQIEEKYLTEIQKLSLNPQLDKSSFSLVFSPQHGTSYRLVPQLFTSMGYHITPVKEQMTVDPNFSETASPNPEDPRAYEKGILLAQEIKADLVMVADPDADRVGLAYRDSKGGYQLLNGNLSGALLVDYIITQRKQRNRLPDNPVMYDTIVCSPLAKKIAESHHVRVESFLTGFKYIGDRIQFYEEHAGPTFIFGYEESYGCLLGSFVRDKDALQALLLYAEMTLYHLSQGQRLDQIIQQLFKRYGYHHDHQYSLALQGEEGQRFLTNLMSRLRQTPFQSMDGRKVIRFEDYEERIIKLANHETLPINLPPANVIKFIYDDGSSVIVRPSGTEPKCKFYVSVVTEKGENLREKVDDLKNDFFKTFKIDVR